MDKPLVSIIIPFKELNQLVIGNIQACLRSTHRKYEIILVPDKKVIVTGFKMCRIIPSGHVGPAIKRDLAARAAKGEILAFVDDDVEPTNYWLAALVAGFRDKDVVAVGGPGVTPPTAKWRESASGWFSASPIGSGGFSYRFLPQASRYVDDYPSMNLAVRKADFWKVGGFDSAYWPGEDTKLCLDLVNKLGKKILYEPTALVYHHRRRLWVPHLLQHGNFGIHRGYFARVLPQTSARLVYFMPSGLVLMTIFFITGIIIGNKWTMVGTGCFLLSYGLAVIVNAIWIKINSGSWVTGFISIPVTISTHLWYGIKFIQGYVFTRKLTQ